MQPEQQPQSPSPQEPLPSPSPEYNFIFNDQQKSKKRFNIKIPGFSSLPRWAVFMILGAIVLIIVIPVASAIFRKTPNSQLLINSMAKAQEIIRISELVEHQSTDPNTQNLAATTKSSLTSQQGQLKSYLASKHTKVRTKELTVYLNKGNDTQLQIATQNNSLSATYASYLKKNLGDYEKYLQQIYGDSSTKAKAILQEGYTSAQVILKDPQIANASS